MSISQDTTIYVSSVSIAAATQTIDIGNNLQLLATVLPGNADNKAVTWSTSGETVLTVDSNGLISGIGAGTATITVITEDGGKTDSCSFTVLKKNAGVTAPTAKTSLTYNTNTQILVNAGETVGSCQWQYSLNNNSSYSTTVPSATNAGTYTVYYKLIGDNTYNDIAEASVQVTIAKKDATITTTSVTKEYTYTGSEQTVNSGATVDSGATLTYTNNKFTDRPNTGKQTITINAAETANYNAASTTVEITINKAKQDAPSAPSATDENIFQTSITLTAVSPGKSVKYGYNTTNTTPTIWQDDVKFTDLKPNTPYYFFAKYVENNNYKEAVSEGREIKTVDSCFVAGTKISMADGTLKNIEDIVVGDSVKSYDIVKGEFYTTTINKVWTSANTTISTITLTDGTQIQCTPNHPICTTEGFKSVNPNFTGGLNEYPSTKLNIGDMVVTDHGTFAVSSIEINVGESVAVYNLSVVSNGNELNNTFVANGVVAHNKPM